MSELFVNNCRIVLASASPRRQQFLQELGIAYSLVPASGVEPEPNAHELPEDYALRAALAKGRHVAKHHADLVLAADTVVCIDGKILGKPQDSNEALHMLKLLAGKSHTVISAVSIIFAPFEDSREELCFFDSTEVCFHPWPVHVLAKYAECGEPLDKAGAYAIQGKGAFLVKYINGSWSNVVGLPVTKLVDVLLARGIITTC